METTPATTPDGELTQEIHEALAEKKLLPAEHILDSAYMDAEHIVTSQTEYNVNLIGRVNENLSWQAKEKDSMYLALRLIGKINSLNVPKEISVSLGRKEITQKNNSLKFASRQKLARLVRAEMTALILKKIPVSLN